MRQSIRLGSAPSDGSRPYFIPAASQLGAGALPFAAGFVIWLWQRD